MWHSYLVRQLQIREERYVARPFNGAEEQARGQLADVLNTKHVGSASAGSRRLKADSAARRAGDRVKRAGSMEMRQEVVWFGADQQRHEAARRPGGRQAVDRRGADADRRTRACTAGREHDVSWAEVARRRRETTARHPTALHRCNQRVTSFDVTKLGINIRGCTTFTTDVQNVSSLQRHQLQERVYREKIRECGGVAAAHYGGVGMPRPACH